MAHAIFIDNTGRQVALSKELGRGGEATVFEIEGDPTLVAKIYRRQLDLDSTVKLSRMVEFQNERLLKLAAWPVGTLRSKNGSSVAGILMKNIRGFKDIHLLYNPKSRMREFPAKADWRFLIHTAANVARAFAVIHEYRHVIGDVNQSNVRVSPESAVVNLIDCDSFQIFSNGHYFLCGVGVPLYTPPELQGKQFKSIIRTPNQDNFGLAVLIFHLLFLGRHPFAGKFRGRGDMPIEKAIGEYRFAFAPDRQRTQLEPPPNCITLAHLSPEVRTYFLDAFSPASAKSGRPDATQWVTALDALARQLRQCSVNKAHIFYRGLSECPWCTIEGRVGFFLFVGYSISAGPSGFNLDMVWAQLVSVPSPGPSAAPDFSSLTANVRASLQAKAAGWKRRTQTALVVATSITIVLACLVVGVFSAAFWLGLICFAVSRKVIHKSGLTKSRFKDEARATEARFRAIQDRWPRETTEQPFIAKSKELKALADEYRQLPNRRQQKIRDLERDQYNVQLRHFLEKFDIATAHIPHVKDSRKAMLASYGIDTAADVNAVTVEAVPGFGQFLTQQIMTWRRSIESKFQYDPKRGLDPTDIQRVDREIAKRRIEIESTLRKGRAELEGLRSRILAVREQLHGELQKARTEVDQAYANARAA